MTNIQETIRGISQAHEGFVTKGDESTPCQICGKPSTHKLTTGMENMTWRDFIDGQWIVTHRIPSCTGELNFCREHLGLAAEGFPTI